MYCQCCGNPIKEDAKFCGSCGKEISKFEHEQKISNVNDLQENQNLVGEDIPKIPVAYEKKEVKKKNKEKIVAIGVVIVLILFVMIFKVIGNNKYVEFVKNGCPRAYPNTSYGEAFGSFFSNPSWKYFKSNNGEDIVEFKGDCFYQEVDVTATIQFVLDYDNEACEISYFDMNGVKQNLLVTGIIISKIFDDYEVNINYDVLNKTNEGKAEISNQGVQDTYNNPIEGSVNESSDQTLTESDSKYEGNELQSKLFDSVNYAFSQGASQNLDMSQADLKEIYSEIEDRTWFENSDFQYVTEYGKDRYNYDISYEDLLLTIYYDSTSDLYGFDIQIIE